MAWLCERYLCDSSLQTIGIVITSLGDMAGVDAEAETIIDIIDGTEGQPNPTRVYDPISIAAIPIGYTGIE